MVSLFEVMFYASLRAEEASSVTFEVTYIDPTLPDPAPPEQLLRNRWRFIPLASPLPFDVATVVKLALATDGRASSLAVFGDDDQLLRIVGLVDEGVGHRRQRTLEGLTSDSPGWFHAAAVGVGRLAVFIESEFVAELDGDRLLQNPVHAFEHGLVADLLREHFSAELELVADRASELGVPFDADLYLRAGTEWITALRRLLIRCRDHRHGGAVLLTSDPSDTSLKIKYGLQYDRLPEALSEWVVRRIAADVARAAAGGSVVAAAPVLEVLDSEQEVNDVLWFLSLLTRVDGLLLMDGSMRARGFGVEILEQVDPEEVVIAEDARALRRWPVSLERWGTRHRSMIRFCARHPGSVGFVVSQDGDVRVVLEDGGQVVVFQGVSLERDFALGESDEAIEITDG